MTTVEVYKEPLYKRYYAPYWSFTFLFKFMIISILVIVPYIFAHSMYSDGIWAKQISYFEQPKLNFEYKVLVIIRGLMNNNNKPFEIFYSTMDSVNELRQDNGYRGGGTTRSSTMDDNLDGIIDLLEIETSIPLNEGEEIYNVDTVIWFNGQFDKKVNILLEGQLVHLHHDACLPATRLAIDGSLELRQGYPIPQRNSASLKKEIYFHDVNDSLVFPKEEGLFSNSWNIENILQRYASFKRHIRFDYNLIHKFWSSNNINITDEEQQHFKIKVKIANPVQHLYLRPTPSELLMDAWVKYFSVFLLLGCLIQLIQAYLIGGRVLGSHERIDVTVKSRL